MLASHHAEGIPIGPLPMLAPAGLVSAAVTGPPPDPKPPLTPFIDAARLAPGALADSPPNGPPPMPPMPPIMLLSWLPICIGAWASCDSGWVIPWAMEGSELAMPIIDWLLPSSSLPPG